MISRLDNMEGKRETLRTAVRVMAWILNVLSTLIILQFMWEFTRLSSNAPVEEFVKNLVTDENDDYSHKEIMEMTIGYLVGQIVWHMIFLIVGLCLLNRTRKDSEGTIKYCLLFLTILFALSCFSMFNDIRHSNGSGSIIFNSVFLGFQIILFITVACYLKSIINIRKAEINRRSSLRSHSPSSDITELYI